MAGAISLANRTQNLAVALAHSNVLFYHNSSSFKHKLVNSQSPQFRGYRTESCYYDHENLKNPESRRRIHTVKGIFMPVKGGLKWRSAGVQQSNAYSTEGGSSNYVDLIRNQQVLKDSDEECRKVLASANSRFLPYLKGQPLVSHQGGHEPAILTREEVEPHVSGDLGDSAVWLKTSTTDGAVTFAVPLDPDVDVSQFPGKFTNLRLAMLFIGSRAPMLSQGYSLLRWHRVTKFCASCGSGNVKKSVSGNRRTCGDCNTVYYPPTSPVGISLVSSPDHSQVLLQRQPMYPKGMYSCIAGFVDVGETLFECLKREVAEEGGVELLPDSPCEIISSQHWPFPAGSLMVGCMVYADPGATKPTRDDLSGEIEDVAWFEAGDVRRALAFIDTSPRMRLEGSEDGSLFVPPKGTIANQMLTAWVNKYHSSE